MSDVETVQTDATAAPVENTALPQEQTQATPQESAPVEAEGQPRDDKGRFEPVQKRINELTRRYHDEARARQSLESELQQLREQVTRANQPLPPDPNDDPHGWIAHTAREEARALLEAERKTQAQQQEQQRIASIAREYASREEAYSAEHPDYAESVEAFVSVAGANPQLAEVLMTSEHGPAVAHYLGQHLDEAAQISRLPAHLAAAAVARLEAKVSAPKAKPVSTAPAPAPALPGKPATAQKNPDDMSVKEWLAWRNDQLKQR